VGINVRNIKLNYLPFWAIGFIVYFNPFTVSIFPEWLLSQVGFTPSVCPTVLAYDAVDNLTSQHGVPLLHNGIHNWYHGQKLE
jgi:hypothetical protein